MRNIAIAIAAHSTTLPKGRRPIRRSGTSMVKLEDYRVMKVSLASREKYAREGRKAFVTLEENEKRRAKKTL